MAPSITRLWKVLEMPGLLQGSEEDGHNWDNSLINASGAGHSDRNVAARAKVSPAPPPKGKRPPSQERWVGEGVGDGGAVLGLQEMGETRT